MDVKSCLSFLNKYVCENKILLSTNNSICEKDKQATVELNNHEEFAKHFADW